MACMALHDYDSAVAAFTQGADLEPADKSFQDQLAKARTAAASAAATPPETHSRPSTEAAAPRTEVKRTKTTETAQEKPATTTTAASSSNGGGSEMRGYKVLEDGRKTTYGRVAGFPFLCVSSKALDQLSM